MEMPPPLLIAALPESEILEKVAIEASSRRIPPPRSSASFPSIFEPESETSETPTAAIHAAGCRLVPHEIRSSCSEPGTFREETSAAVLRLVSGDECILKIDLQARCRRGRSSQDSPAISRFSLVREDLAGFDLHQQWCGGLVVQHCDATAGVCGVVADGHLVQYDRCRRARCGVSDDVDAAAARRCVVARDG